MRGPIGLSDKQRVSEFLGKEGIFKTKKERVLIDYSMFLPNQGISQRTKDIRLRTTNGVSEIVIKTGSWGGNDQRNEYSAKTESTFDNLVQIYKLLGYSKGMLCVRYTNVFEYKGIEIAIVEVPNHSYYFEAELELQPGDDVNKAQEEINTVLKELQLESFSDEEYFKYIETLNKEVNTVFDANLVENDYFRKNYNV